ncbi:putative AbiEii toxin of type IV toxin-antitoxin system [Acinetobacter sp. BIGb0102]|uniref:AAA family ATPase n=1 Tax=Acinetobacter sp. BIGb0102 TaxID=2485131 RepID=UPI000F4D8341|nr:ATP-binding protein [Acinetobacter sp. BIGb0102]RPE30292.1 putative AbiEii toxin of type IV toxin-antitoxin system [Acinetobacter sp. BIGb0102]
MEDFSEVNFLVGVNGSGKSRLLNTIGQQYLNENDHVIAISNTVFDKFSSRGYKKLSARGGKFFLKDTIVDSFLNRSNSIYKILEYLGYEKQITGLVSFYSDFDGEFLSYFIRRINKYNKFDVTDDNGYIDYNLDELEGFCKQLEKVLYRYNDYEYIFEFGYWDGRENSINLSIFEKLYMLFGGKKIFKIDFILYKGRVEFNLDGASSGESHFLAQMLFLSVNLSKNKRNIILIDEPEISLHPKWQRDYIFQLYDYFYKYNCKFFLATHSPLIISKLQASKKDLHHYYVQDIPYKTFNIKDGNLEIIHEDDDYSIESLYWEVFGVLTPNNSFLSRYCVDLLDKYDIGVISLNEIQAKFKELKEAADLNVQKETLGQIESEYLLRG